jgi:hypothetical protein
MLLPRNVLMGIQGSFRWALGHLKRVITACPVPPVSLRVAEPITLLSSSTITHISGAWFPGLAAGLDSLNLLLMLVLLVLFVLLT